MFKAIITGDKESLKILCKYFKNYVKFEDKICYLECPQFQSLSDHSEVLSFAQEKLRDMLSILNLEIGGNLHAQIHEVHYLKKNGNKIISTSLDILCKMEIKSPKIVSTKNLEPYLTCFKNNSRIKDAFSHFNKDKNWFNLFKSYEIVEHDMGGKLGIVNSNWATEADIDLFRCTAHNVDGAGEEARHGVKEKINAHCINVLSTQDPMKITIATSLIKKILSNWISYRCP